MITVTSTTLDIAAERLTVTVIIDTGDGEPITTNPSFTEAALRDIAAKANPPRTDYCLADIIAATTTALGVVAPAPAPPASA